MMKQEFVSRLMDECPETQAIVGEHLADFDDDILLHQYVQNVISVWFVEDTPLWDPTMESFIATWPQPLQVEAARQRAS